MKTFISHPFYGQTDSFQAISNTFRYYKNHFFPLFIISLVTNAFTYYIANRIVLFENLQPPKDPQWVKAAFISNEHIAWIIGAIIIYTLGYLTIVYYTVYQSKSHRLPFLKLIKNAILQYYGRFLIVLVLSTTILVFGTFIGIIFFFIGIIFTFFYFSTVLLPAMPILIAEGTMPFDSIVRSFRLTHQDFMNALGSWLIFLLFLIIISLFLSFIVMLPNIFNIMSTLFSEGGLEQFFKDGFIYGSQTGIGSHIAQVITSSLLYPLFPIFTVALYFKLKFKEETYIVSSSYL